MNGDRGPRLPGVPKRLFDDLKWCAGEEDNVLEINGEDARHILKAISIGRKLAKGPDIHSNTHQKRHPPRTRK